MEPIEMIAVKGSAQSPRNTEADLVELLDGRLLLAWTEFYGGTCGDHDLARISGKTSDDRGRTWSGRFTVVDSEGAWNNCMEPDFQRLPSEELLLFYMHKNSRMDTRVFLRRSKDDGETWSERYPVSYDRGYHCTTNARSIRTSSGRLVLPVMLRGTVFAYVSDDDGQTWRHGLPPITGYQTPQFDEPAVAELRNGDLLMFLRNSTGRIWQSISRDGGETWSVAIPTELAASSSPISLRRFPRSGDLLVIWSQASRKDLEYGLIRTRLSCAVSKDEGMTWECFNNFESLDNQTRVEPAELWAPEGIATQVCWDSPVPQQGYLNCCYPSCTFIGDWVYVTYFVAPEYSSEDLREQAATSLDARWQATAALKLRVLPVEWFYAEHGWDAARSVPTDMSALPHPDYTGED